ncbi:MAG: hypothetical protein F6J97_22525 [Leptolyngbya sp. SIO4C1]|nr:hypothetical protein [Leptolyngbya sp. SIO4C1]
MALTTVSVPTVYLAGDIGSSSSKFFYRVHPNQTVPLWMEPEVVDNLAMSALPKLMGGGRPQDNAWLVVGEQGILVGDAARALLEQNSLVANKADHAAYKIAAALGVIAELEGLPSDYEAMVWLALPLAEMKTREEITQQLEMICEQGFNCRGKAQRVKLTLRCLPEGFGLYLNRKQQLKQVGKSIEARRTLVVMMGHRNLSILNFEGGSLRMGGSNSNGPGFWPIFEKSARSLGVTISDYRALTNAVMTGQSQQISPARGKLFDFGERVEAVRQSYWKAASVYLRDYLLPWLENQAADVLVSGGATVVFQDQLSAYFEELGVRNVIFADGEMDRLVTVVSQLPEVAMNPSLPLRMTDCYGLFQGLMGKVNKVTV